jgi:hypothetical protein
VVARLQGVACSWVLAGDAVCHTSRSKDPHCYRTIGVTPKQAGKQMHAMSSIGCVWHVLQQAGDFVRNGLRSICHPKQHTADLQSLRCLAPHPRVVPPEIHEQHLPCRVSCV